MPKKKCGEKSMIWIEALAKVLFVMFMVAFVTIVCVVAVNVIKALIEVLIRRWRRKHDH